MAPETPLRGVAHHHTDEELRAYHALTPDQKLRWLEEAWQLTTRFLPPERREIHRRLRAGEL